MPLAKGGILYFFEGNIIFFSSVAISVKICYNTVRKGLIK